MVADFRASALLHRFQPKRKTDDRIDNAEFPLYLSPRPVIHGDSSWPGKTTLGM
jgi:hypothetical protein